MRKIAVVYWSGTGNTEAMANAVAAGAKAAGIDGFYLNRLAVFHEPEQVDYRYVSKNGSLMEVLIQTGVIEHAGQG